MTNKSNNANDISISNLKKIILHGGKYLGNITSRRGSNANFCYR